MENTSTALGQQKIILKHFKQEGSMSTQYARDKLGIPHPAGRVCELRQAGHHIITHWDTEHTPDGKPHRMAKYVFMSEAEK